MFEFNWKNLDHLKGNTIALNISNNHYSYSFIYDKAVAIASLLLSKNIKRVSCNLPNSWELMACYVACIKAGVTLLPVSQLTAKTEYNNIIISFNIDAELIVNTNNITTLRLTKKKKYGNENSLEDLINKKIISDDLIGDFNQENIALILLTSGSTGKPKGVLHSYRSIKFNLKNWQQVLDLKKESKFFTNHGVLLILASFFSGAELTLPPSDLGKSDLLDYIAQAQPNIIFMMPSFYVKLAKQLLKKTIKPLNISYLLTGGDQLPTWVHKTIKEKLYKSINFGYGMTEIPLISVNLKGNKLVDKNNNVGKPLEGIEVSILPNGNITVSSEGLFSGYEINGKKYSNVLKNGFFIAEDIGFLDENNILFLIGRSNQMIETIGKELINSNEIEHWSNLYHSIQRTCLIIKKNSSLNKKELYFFLETTNDKLNINKFKNSIIKQFSLACPSQNIKIIIQEKLPDNNAGKIDRLLLNTFTHKY